MGQHRQEDQSGGNPVDHPPPGHGLTQLPPDDFPTVVHRAVGAPPTPRQPAVFAPSPTIRAPLAAPPVASLYLDGSNRVFDLRVGGNVVGRGRDVDIQLDDSAVSGRHLDIRWDGDQAVLNDIGSTNGTGINGRVLHSAWTLRSGDVISLGRSRLIFQTG